VGAFHRVIQFWQALTAAPGPAAPPELGPGLRELFLSMPRADRAHALRTYRTLAAVKGQPADLLTAALLHDLGKCSPQVRLWDRVLFVLASNLAPGWLERLPGAPAASRWPGLVALQGHAERGARLVATRGATPRTVRLIRWHHASADSLGWPEGERRLLEALQRADERS
jgi:hypothetical protein